MAVKPAWLPSIPYPPAREDGYWAPITSTLDWCEEVGEILAYFLINETDET